MLLCVSRSFFFSCFHNGGWLWIEWARAHGIVVGVFIEDYGECDFWYFINLNIRNLKRIYANLCTPTCVCICIEKVRWWYRGVEEITMFFLSEYEFACLLRITICCALRWYTFNLFAELIICRDCWRQLMIFSYKRINGVVI